ncbi:AFG1-like ATPase [Cristinia sonorae]|uniref:AFG1-like ATPase n=1 Tax=Cristinia sonorae TaxID=1940300 RepID=A0A8K0ULC5_9AGAR|nr:AFG1-like ATPase [Cristinia sonorae]
MKLSLIPRHHLLNSASRLPRPARALVAARAYRRAINTSANANKRLNSSLAVELGSSAHHEASDAILHGKQATRSPAPEPGTSLHRRSPLLSPLTNDIAVAVSSPLQQYYKLVESGTLRADDHQTRIIQRLQRLHDDLTHYDPPLVPTPSSSSSIFSRLFSSSEAQTISPDKVPRGLYLYGDVGTGKTMLMDLFYNTLHPRIKRKRRVHFHAFMIDVHQRVHEAKLKLGSKGGDPIEPVARDLANEASVLCFDEFQVTDIADAMILRQLFERLMNYGVVCVMTSNRHPDELYRNGIQRSSFVPCIDLIKTRCEVTDLDSGTDYRRLPRTLSHVYYHPLDDTTRLEFTKLFRAFTHSDPDDPLVHNRTLTTWGRAIPVPQSTSKVAKWKFEELCGRALSAADYLEITKNFGTIFVEDVPKMGLSQKDMARRFITFIDACYENQIKLFVSSEVPITKVFADDPNAKNSGISDEMRSAMDDLGLSPDVVGASSIFSGEEEIFAFARCCSRLVQMGSKEWAESHKP